MTVGASDPPSSAPSTDGSALQAWVRALESSAAIAREPYVTFPVVIDRLAAQYGSAPALADETATLTYQALAERANRYARWALGQGLRKGDVVCLLMPNSVDYPAAWLGLTRVGAVVALLNTQLTGERLAHCIDVVNPHLIIAADALLEALRGALVHIRREVRCWIHGREAGSFPRLDDELAQTAPGAPPEESYAAPTLKDRALYIYTSGTTGLPKAANVSHLRVMQWTHWFAGMLHAQPQDRMFNCLPMYHSIGGIVATGAPLVGGGTVIVRQRFSASDFWKDVVGSGCTLFQYIGELCRYLLNSPPHPLETQHRLRLCCGNGMRPEVWEPFQRRFRIPRILEYYAATEGNFSLYNCEGKPGAIGRIPQFLSHRLPVALVRSDPQSGEPVRDAAGRCIRCAANEVGEAIGRIQEKDGHAGQFEGYTDEAASQRKVLRDVFAPGDAWYRTGDLMRRDPQGFYYFVDRIGDTFRWKGENVSTMEVAEVIGGCRGVLECVAYGVAVPGTEGRAGMAALVVNDEFDVNELQRHAAAHLPDYARPLFVRILPRLEATATFKPRKQELAREGFDPALISDRLYFSDRAGGGFVALDAALYQRLQSGDVRL